MKRLSFLAQTKVYLFWEMLIVKEKLLVSMFVGERYCSQRSPSFSNVGHIGMVKHSPLLPGKEEAFSNISLSTC